MNGLFLSASAIPTELLSLGNSLTVAGVLLVAVVVLGRMYLALIKKSDEDAKKAQETAAKAHEKQLEVIKNDNERYTKLLQEQMQEQGERNAELAEQLKTERVENLNRYEKITADYNDALESFKGALEDMRSAINEQTASLKEVFHKVDAIENTIYKNN